MTDDAADQPFDEWLSERIEQARETYKTGTRSENPRRTDIALGKLRALKNARTEYLNRTVVAEGDATEEADSA